ncbi:MAG: DEAD/DEAH box helicase [Verrucomicrobia bacterium]|nr:DEAD/DEAH box helicase [Verrucomicrobiota bacterium]
MLLYFEYDRINNNITILPEDFNSEEWSSFIRIISDYSRNNYEESILQIECKLLMPCQIFLGIKNEIKKYLINHKIKPKFSPEITKLLKSVNPKSYSTIRNVSDLTEEQVKNQLEKVGFSRVLTSNQMKNVRHLAVLPAGATFSVPGSGKTTEALAYYFCNAQPEDHLLVVGPLSAMGAWEAQMQDCCPNMRYEFVRLRGGKDNIDKLLRDNPKFMLISYGQFVRARHLIQEYLSYHSVIMFLDESHRIKNRFGVSPQEVLRVSYLPKKKLIMSGTPCPQSISDLIPQFEFLYPDQPVDQENVVRLFQPIYVRTTKGQLEIPSAKYLSIPIDMHPLQKEIYQSIRFETKRQIGVMLSNAAKNSLRDIGKKIIKIMEFVSNPSLLASDMEYIFDKKLGYLLAVNSGPKVEYACQRARELAAEGKKVIIWSQFVTNVLLMTERLKDIGADCIYGGVDSGDEEEEDTREWKIKEFHKNNEKMVLVLNPAAASEAISLHKICHHAIYVDRSFNAAHYLQSVDRIHRLGITQDEAPIIEILECKDTIDEVVNLRLRSKIETMAKALNDTSLNIESIPYDIDFSVEDIGEGMDKDDIQAVINYFFRDTKNE